MPHVPHALTGLVLLCACVPATAPSADGSDASTTDDASTTSTGAAETTDGGSDLPGDVLFVQLCSACHGADAEGVENVGYELRHSPREYARWIIRNGRSGTELAPSVMAPFTPGALAESDVDKILDYLEDFPKPTTGEALYLDYCRNCHGLDAAGGESGKDIREELYQLPTMLRAGGRGDYGDRTLYMPVWTEAELSDDDSVAIATWVESL